METSSIIRNGCRSAVAALAILGLAACGDTDPDAPATDTDTDTEAEAASAATATGEDVVTVDLKGVYSEALFVGTGAPMELDNLEQSPPEPVMELRVPAGANQNVALNKPVTSSDSYDPIIGNLEMITDDDTGGGEGSYVELGPDLQWVQIDLEQEHEIFAIHVWHFHKTPVAYIDVVVQIANKEEFENEDGTTADHVVTVFNADHDGSTNLGLPAGTDPAYVETNHGRLIEVDGVTGRYVRLYSNGNTNDPLNHYVEVMVYGRPAGSGDTEVVETEAADSDEPAEQAPEAVPAPGPAPSPETQVIPIPDVTPEPEPVEPTEPEQAPEAAAPEADEAAEAEAPEAAEADEAPEVDEAVEGEEAGDTDES